MGTRIVIVVLLLLLAACHGPVRDLYPEDPAQRTVDMYLVSHGWHVGIAVESAYVRHLLPDHPQIPDAHYLKFGWGDGKYYPDADAGFGLLMRAAFLPTRSVLHIVGVDIPLPNYFAGSRIVKVQVTEEGAEEFARFVDRRLRRDGEGAILYATDGRYSNSAFFEATGRYYLPKTSNGWTARALRQTGFPITSIYSRTSGNVLSQVGDEGEVLQ